MRRFAAQISLKQTLAAVLFVAVAFGFMRHALNAWGPGEVVTLAVLVLVGGSVLSQVGRGRPFWRGFAMVGWAYLAVSFVSSLSEHLPTVWLLDRLHTGIYGIAPSPTHEDFGQSAQAMRRHQEAF